MTKTFSLIDLSNDVNVIYDISQGDKVFKVSVSQFSSISLSIFAENLTGTLDASLHYYKSDFDDFSKAIPFDTANDKILSSNPTKFGYGEDNFNPRYLFIELKQNNCTGGDLMIAFTNKVQ